MHSLLISHPAFPIPNESTMILSQPLAFSTKQDIPFKSNYPINRSLSSVLSFPLLEKIWIPRLPLLTSTWIWQYSPSTFASTLITPPLHMLMQCFILRALNHCCLPTLTDSCGLIDDSRSRSMYNLLGRRERTSLLSCCMVSIAMVKSSRIFKIDGRRGSHER